jgi:RNA polymerase sigma factor (sigma-70 family)
VKQWDCHHMVDWTRTSERYLVFLLRKRPNSEDSQAQYDELRRRLQRYFRWRHSGWELLRRHEDDIVTETILKLLYPVQEFRGNSVQFRKYIRRTLFTTCVNILKEEQLLLSLDEPQYGSDSVSEMATLLELLSAWPGPSSVRTSLAWQETADLNQVQSLEELYAREEMMTFIEKSRAGLDERCRELLHREDDLEQPQQQIAVAMQMSHTNVRVKLLRCRQRLLRSLLEALAAAEVNLAPAKIEVALSQLPDPPQRFLWAWWQGETSWKKLGRLIEPEADQDQTKRMIAEGLLRLFVLLQAPVTGGV